MMVMVEFNWQKVDWTAARPGDLDYQLRYHL